MSMPCATIHKGGLAEVQYLHLLLPSSRRSVYHNTVIEGESGVPDLYMIELSLLINKTILSLAILHMKLDLYPGQFAYLKTPDI